MDTPEFHVLAELGRLGDNWDDEGAPEAAHSAVQQAKQVLGWARRNSLNVASVEADVLGGVAVYLNCEASAREAWIACMNDGAFTAVLSKADEVVDHFMMDLDGVYADRILRFLRGVEAREAG